MILSIWFTALSVASTLVAAFFPIEWARRARWQFRLVAAVAILTNLVWLGWVVIAKQLGVHMPISGNELAFTAVMTVLFMIFAGYRMYECRPEPKPERER